MMELFIIILSVLSIAVLLGLIIKPKYGVALYIVYMYLAPWIYIGGFQIYKRTFSILLCGLFFFQYWKKMVKFDYRPLVPYMIFILLQILFVVTAQEFDVSFYWYMHTLCNFFFILYLYAVIVKEPSSIKLIKWTLFSVFCGITAYGIFLTTMPGLNPLKMIQMPIFGGEFNEAYAAGNSGNLNDTSLVDGRLFGRISSVFDHPMQYGLNLGLFAIYSLYLLRNKIKILVLIEIVILIAIIVSGVRTPIMALMVTILFFLLYLRKVKYMLIVAITGMLIFIILPTILPDSIDYIMSVFNSESSNTTGSSFSMRMMQLEGVIEIASENPLLGNGYGWHYFYNALHGAHPKALYFESLLFTAIVETGIIGIFIWVLFLSKYYKINLNISRDRIYQATLLSLMVFYLAYSFITGDMGINYMLVFYVVLLGMKPDKSLSTTI